MKISIVTASYNYENYIKETIKNLRDLLQKDWNKIVYLRGYMALVEGKGLKNGTLKNYLAESKSQQVYVTSKEKGKLAITHYKAIKEMKEYIKNCEK